MTFLSKEITFYKLQGSGNDFVILINDELKVPTKEMPLWARRICPRAFSVGADGLIFLERTNLTGLDYVWHFFNADGSKAEMCGNGSRCAAKLAYLTGLAPRQHTFGTDAGPIRAEVKENGNLVKVQLTPYKDLELNISLPLKDQKITVHFVNTGVPHTIFFSEHLEQEDLSTLGPAIRWHKSFAPHGTNVNVVQLAGADLLLLRTYERGVEDETFACGTGAVAAALIANKLGLVNEKVKVITSGKEKLTVFLEETQIFLQGQAVLIYQGHLNPELLN